MEGCGSAAAAKASPQAQPPPLPRQRPPLRSFAEGAEPDEGSAEGGGSDSDSSSDASLDLWEREGKEWFAFPLRRLVAAPAAAAHPSPCGSLRVIQDPDGVGAGGAGTVRPKRIVTGTPDVPSHGQHVWDAGYVRSLLATD